MASQRQPLRFGLFTSPDASSYEQTVRHVRQAEQGGLELIGIQDHPYQRRFLDTFTLIADLLARTERITLFPDVANLPLRGPAMLAKAAASLDAISGGRFELGIGAGGFWDPIVAMGGARRTPGESVDALEEAIAIIRAALDGERSVSHAGEHYSVEGYKPGPAPAHRVGIWVGAYKPRMLALTGRLADGWLPSQGYAGPEEIPAMRERIDAAAAEAGRDPAAVQGIYNVSATITDVGRYADELARFREELGFDAFVFSPREGDVDEQIRLFVDEVVPAVRRAVG